METISSIMVVVGILGFLVSLVWVIVRAVLSIVKRRPDRRLFFTWKRWTAALAVSVALILVGGALDEFSSNGPEKAAPAAPAASPAPTPTFERQREKVVLFLRQLNQVGNSFEDSLEAANFEGRLASGDPSQIGAAVATILELNDGLGRRIQELVPPPEVPELAELKSAILSVTQKAQTAFQKVGSAAQTGNITQILEAFQQLGPESDPDYDRLTKRIETLEESLLARFNIPDREVDYRRASKGSADAPKPTAPPAPAPTPAARPRPTQVAARVAAGAGITLELMGFGTVTIPALPTDWTATMTALAQLDKEPPAGWITTIGPVLSLSFRRTSASILPQQPSARLVSTHSLAKGDDGSMQFVIDFSRSTAKGFEGTVPMAHINLRVNEDAYLGLPGTVDVTTKTATVTVPKEMVNELANSDSFTVNVGLATIRQPITSPPLARYGPRVWNGSRWVDFPNGFDPKLKTLVLVHGILSSVEGAFPCAGAIAKANGYDQVIGFDYRYTDGVQESGRNLAAFLDRLHVEYRVKSVGIEAHSYGVPTTITAGSLSQMQIDKFISLGGPITGTYAAHAAPTLLTLLSNLNLKDVYVPAAGIRDLRDFLSGEWAKDMWKGNPALTEARAEFARKHPETFIQPVVGTQTFLHHSLSRYLFGNIPNDGIVDVPGARGDGSGLKTAEPLEYDLTHSDLQCTAKVIEDVGKSVTRPVPAAISKPVPTPTPTAAPTPSPTPTPTIQPVSVQISAPSCTLLSRREAPPVGVQEDFAVTVSGTATGPVGTFFALAWGGNAVLLTVDDFRSSWTRYGSLSSASRAVGEPETTAWSQGFVASAVKPLGKPTTFSFGVNVNDLRTYDEAKREVTCPS